MSATIFWLVISLVSPKGAQPKVELVESQAQCEQKAEASKLANLAWCVPLIIPTPVRPPTKANLL